MRQRKNEQREREIQRRSKRLQNYGSHMRLLAEGEKGLPL